jgi:HD superfamily phosphohydrolase
MAFSPPHKKVKMDASQSSTPLAGSTPVRKSSLAFGGRTSSFVKPHRRDKESTFNDPIHGSITMQGLCLSIIDTKEFQRLRKLMQLGTCSYVFYGATHTRFEHSIGVSHFAGMVARNLQTSQPYLGITEEDILCVKVAGLCHDLGHGPFSHVFDGVFIPRIVPNTSWRHEDGSVQMLKYLLGKNRIDHREYGLNDRDLLFIEEIIAGTKEADRRGRGYEKFYLYDIVNNSRSGLDVDKLDYFMRDMRYTNASSSTCNFQRFIELGRVFPADPIQHTALRLSTGSTGALGEEEPEREHYMICYPEKMVKEALDVFAVRFRLHQTIYTHKSVKKVEFMVSMRDVCHFFTYEGLNSGFVFLMRCVSSILLPSTLTLHALSTVSSDNGRAGAGE